MYNNILVGGPRTTGIKMNIKDHTDRVKRPPNQGATKQRQKKDYDAMKSMKNIKSKYDTRTQWFTEFPEASIESPQL